MQSSSKKLDTEDCIVPKGCATTDHCAMDDKTPMQYSEGSSSTGSRQNEGQPRIVHDFLRFDRLIFHQDDSSSQQHGLYAREMRVHPYLRISSSPKQRYREPKPKTQQVAQNSTRTMTDASCVPDQRPVSEPALHPNDQEESTAR